jgi:hypothetical protein
MQIRINLESSDRKDDITVEDVRDLETFKEWDEGQILELIRTLKTLSVVMYNSWSKVRKIGKEIALGNDNQPDIKIAA